jgi:uncharacterized protein YdeI (YjbR/CyaY-like superfamily)
LAANAYSSVFAIKLVARMTIQEQAVVGEVLQPGHQAEWARWLAANHDKSGGVWLRHARKGAAEPTVNYQEALEVALCFGWIDGIKKSDNAHYWLQRWSA